MAPLLKLREASRLIGVSPGRLYRAIADGRLTAASGGGPGKPTLISLEALQTFCRSEGLRIPNGPSESDAVTSGNGVLKLLLSQGFFSKRRLPEICENANHG
jgi:hypothetical protein